MSKKRRKKTKRVRMTLRAAQFVAMRKKSHSLAALALSIFFSARS